MKVIGEKEDWIFKRKIKELVGREYTVLGTYTGIHKKILIQHNNEFCGNFQFEMRPHEFLKGQRCPYCQKHRKKTTEDIIREIRSKYSGKISLLSEYLNPTTKIKIRCNKCFREQWIFPRELENLKPCFCNNIELSKKRFTEAFKEAKLDFKEDFRFHNILLYGPKFDWVVQFNDTNLLIDFSSENYYKPIYGNKTELSEKKNEILLKKEFCELNNIFYIRIGFWNLGRENEIAEIISHYVSKNKGLTKSTFKRLRADLNLGSYKANK